jgi:hypothetical protein
LYFIFILFVEIVIILLTVVIDGGEKAIGGPPFTNEQGNRFQTDGL